MALLNEYNLFLCGITFLIAVGVILHIVGLATPYWSIVHLDRSYGFTSTFNYGLWSACSETDNCKEIPSELFTDLWKAAGAIAIVGMMLGLGALCFAILYLVLRILEKADIYETKMKVFRTMVLAFGTLALKCILVGIFLYVVGAHWKFKFKIDKSVEDIGYSIILSGVGAGLICLSGVVFYVASSRTS